MATIPHYSSLGGTTMSRVNAAAATFGSDPFGQEEDDDDASYFSDEYSDEEEPVKTSKNKLPVKTSRDHVEKDEEGVYLDGSGSEYSGEGSYYSQELSDHSQSESEYSEEHSQSGSYSEGNNDDEEIPQAPAAPHADEQSGSYSEDGSQQSGSYYSDERSQSGSYSGEEEGGDLLKGSPVRAYGYDTEETKSAAQFDASAPSLITSSTSNTRRSKSSTVSTPSFAFDSETETILTQERRREASFPANDRRAAAVAAATSVDKSRSTKGASSKFSAHATNAFGEEESASESASEFDRSPSKHRATKGIPIDRRASRAQDDDDEASDGDSASIDLEELQDDGGKSANVRPVLKAQQAAPAKVKERNLPYREHVEDHLSLSDNSGPSNYSSEGQSFADEEDDDNGVRRNDAFGSTSVVASAQDVSKRSDGTISKSQNSSIESAKQFDKPGEAMLDSFAVNDSFGGSFGQAGFFDSNSQGDSLSSSYTKSTFASKKELPKITEHSNEQSDDSQGFASMHSQAKRNVGPASFGSPRRMGSHQEASLGSPPSIAESREEHALPKVNAFNGYTREQMVTLRKQPHRLSSNEPNDTGDDRSKGSPKSKKKKKQRPPSKTPSLLQLVANVNDAMVDLENNLHNDYDTDAEPDHEPAPRRLLHGFEALVGILLQLSDELELMATFGKKKDEAAIRALQTLLDFAGFIDSQFIDLKPILQECMGDEIEEEMNDLLYGMNLIIDLLCELTHRIGEKQEWNARINTSYVTLLELLARDAIEVASVHDDMDTPTYDLTDQIHDAWKATGHDEELKTLEVTEDLAMFRQICYEVMLSSDQWCPDTATLMDICGIDSTLLEEQSLTKPDPDAILAFTPETGIQVLEKISGDPLPRTSTMASVLRRILPVSAVNDPDLLESYASIRSTMRNPLGLPTSNLVAISSIPEELNNPSALGVAGCGKTTIAAMVSDHEDVRRHFSDGIAWVYLGHNELNYIRYVQCLRDLLSQLEIDEEDEPLFPELLHTPGESPAKRRRREEGFMIYVRETMLDFLSFKHVLIILDDVCFEADLDWFDFGPPPEPTNHTEDEYATVVLLTTRCRNLLPAADTVEVDMLQDDEAIQLLINESGELSQNLVSEKEETLSVVLECANHPLAVKSVGRWLNLKHATAGVVNSVEEIHGDVVKSMEKILKSGNQEEADMMYEILNMSLSPAINGEPTNIIKFCYAAFVLIFCDRRHISDFALADATPIVPLAIAELLFESLLDLEEASLMKEGSLFYAQKKDAAVLIPEALSALGVLKVIITSSDEEDEGEGNENHDKLSAGEGDEKYLQVMHKIQQEYGEFLMDGEDSLLDLTKDAERRWNKSFTQAYMALDVDWDTDTPDAALDYALEMMPSHMIRGSMLAEAASLLSNPGFVRGRLFALGRENATRRHIKDSETLFDEIVIQRSAGRKQLEPKSMMKQAYQSLGSLLNMDEDEFIAEEGSPEAVEVGRAHFEIGFSLAEKRSWDAAIAHWETCQELFVSSLGMVEVVAGVLYNVGVVYAEMNEYEQALGSLKQCLKVRGAIHGEEHILYAQTIQKIGDIFLGMSDYHEAMESYNWALDVMHIEPSHHRIDIGDILENMGNIHYSKGEIEDSLQCYQDALRSKQVDLGDDHPELATSYHHIGNSLSDQGKTEEAVAHFEEAIRLKGADPDGGDERDADVLTIEGVLCNLNGKQQEGLECYEKALQVLVTKVPHKKEKVASLLHLIGCVYLMSGEHKKAMKLFEESLQARRKVLGFVHLDVASTLFNMAFLHQTRNRLDKALKCLEEALKIRQLRLPDSEKVAVTHEKIGTLARSIGKSKKAEIAFSEALRIRKILHGDQHEAVATVLQELGDLMDDLGEFDDAMKHYSEALDIRHNRLGPDDLAVGETLYSMGFTLQNHEASERALQCFEESLSIRKFQLGDDANEVGDTLNMMGFLQAKRGELDDALSLLWDALRIRKLHDDHVKISETLKNIGNVHREKQEHELAVECYEECLRIRRSELGDDHEKVADALIALGNVNSDMEESHEAMQHYKEALTIRTMVFGEHDESVAAVLQYMGTLEFRAGELDNAMQLLSEFVRIRNDNKTGQDGDYVNVLFMIGNIHKMQGNEEEAQTCWTEAYKVFQALGLADGNPQIAQVMGNLVKDSEDDLVLEQFRNDAPKSTGLFQKFASKVKGTLENDKLHLGRGRGKAKGQQL